MKLHSFKKIVLSCLLLCFYTFILAQYAIPEKPTVLYPVFDEAGLLSHQEKNALNNKLIKFADSTSTEIEVVIISSTKGADINFLATMFGEKWKIGKKGLNSGLVFLIATEDKTMSIQPGRTVEQYLTASVAGQILDYIVTPNFRKGLWYEGINRGTSAIMEAVQGKFKPMTTAPSANGSTFKVLLIAFIIFIIIALIFGNRDYRNNDDDEGNIILTRKGCQNYPGGDFPFSGNFGGSSFGSISSRGGGSGFGGFGSGGSFGGGGASGGW